MLNNYKVSFRADVLFLGQQTPAVIHINLRRKVLAGGNFSVFAPKKINIVKINVYLKV